MADGKEETEPMEEEEEEVRYSETVCTGVVDSVKVGSRPVKETVDNLTMSSHLPSVCRHCVCDDCQCASLTRGSCFDALHRRLLVLRKMLVKRMS